ncbi:hypothetical protein [Paenibacillus contaminans]|uniref:hypothetical protein n=1 Tax=Paenibacillus contaminans TaxID=450362 RepID=UPI0013146FAE|nr:hypothetical protein [Paenibacillus contaminans]
MQAAIWTPELKKAVKGMKRMENQNSASSVISVDEQEALTNVFKSNMTKNQPQPKNGAWM